VGAAPAAPAYPGLAHHDVWFQYPPRDDGDGFSLGPVSLEARSGRILFIVGGNGSGKSSLAKILTGLYRPTGGQVLVDGKRIEPEALGELVSVVFADFYLFPRLYDVSLAGKEALVEQHLELLRLKNKVTLDDKGFSTLDLSTGQRKRLALLKCFLEDRPILLFDEWAADQDPEFRHTFYHELLPALRQRGKLIIAITHDDRYFDLADQIVRLELGQLSHIKPAQDAA
jgi:putative ATP-binding cassette transporter